MNAKAVRFLLRLYPVRFRARYGEEFAAFLQAQEFRWREAVNVVIAAVQQHLKPIGEPDMNDRHDMSHLQHSLVLNAYAYLLAFAAGGHLVCVDGCCSSGEA